MDVGFIHLASALVAMAAGAWVVLRRKGGRSHRRAGWVFAAAMGVLNLTAFAMYDLTGGPGPFHVLAVFSLVGVAIGVAHARRRLPGTAWRPLHAYWMSWSYIGLLAAAASEAMTRIPDSSFWWMVVGASGSVVVTGALVMRSRMPTALDLADPAPPAD